MSEKREGVGTADRTHQNYIGIGKVLAWPISLAVFITQVQKKLLAQKPTASIYDIRQELHFLS